jgi:hypothetical protein
MTAEVFNPAGPTLRVIADSTPSAIAHAVVGLQTPQFRVINEGPQMVWLGVGATQEEAVASASPVTQGESTPGIPLLPGTDEIFTFDSRRFFAAYCAKDTQYVYITSGYGM